MIFVISLATMLPDAITYVLKTDGVEMNYAKYLRHDVSVGRRAGCRSESFWQHMEQINQFTRAPPAYKAPQNDGSNFTGSSYDTSRYSFGTDSPNFRLSPKIQLLNPEKHSGRSRCSSTNIAIATIPAGQYPSSTF